MKYHYQGPGGEIEIKEPLPVRLAESSWFLTGLTVAGLVWAAYYLVIADPAVMVGRELSSNHRQLKSACLSCHVPFTGVLNESCLSAKCHGPKLRNTLHDGENRACNDCHQEHAERGWINAKMDNRECQNCHQALARDPKSPYFASKAARRKQTYVPHKIYSHPDHRIFGYTCKQCHCMDLPSPVPGKKLRTINVPAEDLFKMDSCMECHRHLKGGCQVCHPYHQARKAGRIMLSCIDNVDRFEDLLERTRMTCTPENSLMPGWVDLTICETGEPAVLYGQSPPPNPPTPP